MASIRRLRKEEWRAYRDVRLRALEDAPEAFGASLEEERARPDEMWRERMEAGATSGLDLPLTVEEDGVLLGLAWGRIDPEELETAHLFQMWVAPTLRSRGIGMDLVQSVIDWARAAGAKRVALGVVPGNGPAHRLYQRAGFREEGSCAPVRPGSSMRCQGMVLTL